MRFHTQTAGCQPDRPAAAQQPDPRRRSRRSRPSSAGPSRSTPTPTTRPGPCRRPRPPCSPCASSRSSPRRPGVTNTVDPLGGSWFVESLTNETEAAVWRYLDEIDRRGGMVAAIAEGYPAERDRRRGVPLPARARHGRAGHRRGQPLRRSRGGRRDPAAAGLRGVAARPTWRAWSGRVGSATPSRSRRALAGCATSPRGPGLGRPTSCRRSSSAPRPTPRSARSAGSSARSSASTASRPRSDPASPRTGLPRWPRPVTIAPCTSMPCRSSRTSAMAGVPSKRSTSSSDDELAGPLESRPRLVGSRPDGPPASAWLELGLTVARELAVNETSPTKRRADADWDARGDAINEELRLAWLALPDGRGPQPVPDRPRRAPRLPDRRARGALDQERRRTRSSS